MKSKNTKIQILKKGMAIILASMFVITPIAPVVQATTSLDDNSYPSIAGNTATGGSSTNGATSGNNNSGSNSSVNNSAENSGGSSSVNVAGQELSKIKDKIQKGETLINVNNEVQLRALAELVNSGDNDCKGLTIKLLNNIKINKDVEWEPIGTLEKPFLGTFDGNNKKISNLNYTKGEKNASYLNNIGLFGVIGNEGKVQNLIIDNFNINVVYSDTDLSNNDYTIYHNAGNIAGINKGTIENCKNTSPIQGASYVGGIAGRNEGTIKNCINTGAVKGYAVVGGITGSNNNRIENCKNTGSVTADSSRAGGIAGTSQKDNSNDKNVIQQSINAGTISVGKELAGGIVGENNLKVINCTNEGTVTGKDLIGGIAGKNKSTVEKSKNAGSIAATGDNIGGIIGNNEGTIQESLNTANVTGKNIVGGIAGVNSSNITNCTNKGTITGEITVAGIVALNNAGRILKVKNEGAINGKENVAGIAGGLLEGNIEFAHNAGAVNAQDVKKEGGIVSTGSTKEGTSIAYCLNEGTVGEEELDGIIDTEENTSIKGCIYILSKASGLGSGVGWWQGGLNQCDPIDNTEDSYVCENKIDSSKWNSSLNGAAEVKNISYNGKQVYDRSNEGKVIYNASLGFTIGCTEEGLGCTVTIADITETAPEQVEEEKPEEIKNSIKSIFSQKVSTGEGDLSNTTVTYVISKGENTISDVGNFKKGDVITVTATFNKILKDGQDDNAKVITAEKAPTLEIGSTDNFKEMTATKVESNNEDKTTTITYTYVIEEDVTTINGLRLGGCENIYAVGEDIAKGTNAMIPTQIPENITIKIDNVKPVVNAKIYVENKLETARYTAGKVVLFEVTTIEAIQEIGTKIPTIQVSFSKSGIGKYNYDVDTKKAGCAKYRNEYTTINEDGTTTWVFSYEIQEGDEGNLEFTYIDGKLIDLAGNENDFTIEKIYKSDITGKTWNDEDLNITYKLYKNGKEINGNTHFTKQDKLEVEFEFDKVLYDSIGYANETDLNARLNKDNAPSLYLNGITNFQANAATIENIVNKENEEKTKITYNYDFSKILLDEAITINKLSLKNDMNESVSVTANTSANGVTPYANEYYDKYSKDKDENGNSMQNYGIIDKDALKEFTLEYNLVVDPNQNGTELIGGTIYADTTAPTVKITSSVADRANDNQITYTFEFSEEVVGFEERDIIVNGGTKVENSFKEEIKGLKYTIIVRPILSDSTETTLQVIVKKGACLDLVAKELVEEEKVITLDNVNPVYVDYNVITEKNDSDKITSIIIEAIFNEDLADISKDSLEAQIKFGGVSGKGTKIETVEGNKVKYVYTTSAADGGNCTISLKGYVTDLSGNNSDEKEVNLSNDITLTQTVIKDAENENITYSFKKNDEEIREFSNPVYFIKGDKITVVKTEITSASTSQEIGPAIKATEYTYTVEEDINLTHMKYVKLIEATDELEATAVFAAEAGEGYIDISKANIYFDTIAPTIDISYDVDIKNENDRYTVGKELIINVTTSEEIQQLDKIPEINVSFSESGLGKYNYQKDTTKGNAIYVETKNEKGISTLKYKYVIENGDEGRPIIEFVNNDTIKDLAGNTTNLGIKPVEPDVELEDTWPTSEDGLNMSYTLYKNFVSEENKITEKTYFTKSDKLIVEINYDKVLYARVGTINTVNATSRLTDKYAPSLYLNGNEELTNDTIESTSVLTEYDEQSGKTVITYTYNFDNISEETIALEKLVLKNDKNDITQSNGYFKDGQIIYADKWYPNYLEEHKDLYKFIDKDAIKVINLEDSLVVDPNASEESKIYADTTAPLVNITANVSDPTNADEVEYTFEFSEVVKDFTTQKIKVNGGDIVGELTEVTKGLKYTLKVRPLIPTGNQGTLQVIVEKGACKDLVAIENVRQEKNITIDKIKPIFESYTIREDNNQIIIEAIYNETITEAVIPSLIIGDTTAKGKWEEIKYNDNKVTYIYNTDAADGGKVYAMLIGTAKDLAGNYSDELSEFIESDIILERTVVKPSDENVYYTFEKNDKTIQDFSKPTYFKAKDIIIVTKYETVNVLDEEGNQVNNEDGTPKTQEVQTKYSYEVSDKLNFTHMKYMNLEEPSKDENVGKVTFSTENGIDITTANIYFDTIAPKVELSINPVGEPNQDNIYTEGTELLITATTDEAVQSEEIPEINLSFSNSGAGKYIPNEDSIKGNLEYLEDIETENGRRIWAYRYIVQSGDDGIAILEYAKDINVTDLAGNTTILKGYPKANSGDVKLSDNEIAGTESKVSYELYKNGEQITDFTNNTYFANGDTIKVITKFDKVLYSSWGSSNEVVSKDTVPTLTIDDKKFEVLSVNNTETTTDIAYIYTIDGDSEGLLEKLNINTNKLYAQLKDEKGNISYKTISGTIGNVDISKCNLHIYNSTTSISGNEITIDTLVPTVKIKANVQNPTNADKILYTFEFSEIVKDFTIEDITLNKGKIENSDKFVKKEEGKVYELEVIPDVAEGNVDDVQVIIEKGVCTDRANKGNLKAENVIRVDRKSPIFIGLEAYAPTNSNIKLNEEIDSVQENYGAGAVVTIVATFDENVTADAKLVLQFSESGTAKGTVKTVKNVGNKITYTYEITEGDKGTLSVKAFTGKVVDVVGNETVVTRRIIEGDTIVAKTIAPQLKELKVVSPEEGKYKADTSITIEAIYDEEIYILEDNREIKLLNTNIEVQAEDGTKTYVDNAPELKLKFGNGEERQATVSGYGTKEDGSIDRTKIIYTYTIVEERTEIEKVDNNGVEEEREITLSGDNGELEITSYTNKENAEVCDIAGNKAALNINQTGNTVIADTIRPEVISVEAEVEEPIVSNTGIYYKDGNEVKITVEFAEEVNPAVVKPEILVGFSENGEEPTSYNKCVYEASENSNSTTVEYTYTIQEGENGYLWVKVAEDQFKDIAGNTNAKADATVIENIFADTIDPCLTTNTNSTSSLPTEWKIEYIETDGIATGIIATGIFNEEIFSMRNNAIVPIEEIPTVGLFLNGKLERTSRAYRVEVENGQTKIVYEEDITDIDTTGNISVNFIDGTVYDRAGNKMTIVLTDGDITSPIFKDLKVLTKNGFYKEGEVIEIVARFEEKTRLTTVPTLVVRLGEKTVTLHGEYDLENSENNDTIKVAKYSYEIEAGDNGALNIISLKGQASDGVRTSQEISKVYIDLTDNKVNDVNTNAYELLNSEEYPYANNSEEYENVIADTKDPFIAKVEAKVNGEVIATYTKEEGKDAIISTGRTNANELEYVITFSEPIVANGLTKQELLSNISLYNATIKDLILEYNSITIKAVTLSEAVQSLIISENIVKDRAGNTNDFERFNLVSTDFTKPTIGFISEYNGGTYVIPTNIGKVEIRPNVKIDEEISKIEYKWNNEEYVEIENYSSASDIAVPTKAFTEAGTQVLNIRAIDIAGNVSETSKTYEILNSYIQIKTSTIEYTNKDIIATVVFGRGLTDNRKVTFKAEGSENIVELNAKGINKDGNTEYTIVENGTIYAEAIDRVGNKVFTETTITNIDKVAPEVELTLNGADLIIEDTKQGARIKTVIETSEPTKIMYRWYVTEFDSDKVIFETNWSETREYITSKELETSSGVTSKMYLCVKVIDKAGNETELKSNAFRLFKLKDAEKETKPEVEDGVILGPQDDSAEIDISKLIAFKQDGRFIEISYNNFTETEEYVDIIKEKEITLTEERDGYIDYEYYSYVHVNKPTVITVVGKDACGNEVTATFEVKPETIKGPEFEVVGNPEDWTNQDVKLEVIEEEPLSALTVNGTDILSIDAKVRSNKVITQNGDYKFVATDEYGNTSEKIITVTKIDKDNPVIEKVESSGKDITITAEDATSGIAEYAITNTTEVPVEWSKSNVIKVTNDGTFYAWAKDKAGNITRSEEVVVVDTTAPIIRFDNVLTTVEAGMPIEVNVATDEKAKISYSWDEKEWVDSEEFITSVRVDTKYDKTGKYTLYVKAIDESGNESESSIEFTVTKPATVLDPQVVFEGLYTTQIDGVNYVKVSDNMTIEDVTNKMDKKALCGLTPEYINLAEGNNLKTGSEIILNGDTKYIVVVNGDVNCDGKIDFLGDIISANDYRIGIGTLNTIQKLAADINNDAKIDFISDILAINDYRIGITTSL